MRRLPHPSLGGEESARDLTFFFSFFFFELQVDLQQFSHLMTKKMRDCSIIAEIKQVRP
jgi:hypothetical protein